jgi:hypothetical protein
MMDKPMTQVEMMTGKSKVSLLLDPLTKEERECLSTFFSICDVSQAHPSRLIEFYPDSLKKIVEIIRVLMAIDLSRREEISRLDMMCVYYQTEMKAMQDHIDMLKGALNDAEKLEFENGSLKDTLKFYEGSAAKDA